MEHRLELRTVVELRPARQRPQGRRRARPVAIDGERSPRSPRAQLRHQAVRPGTPRVTPDRDGRASGRGGTAIPWRSLTTPNGKSGSSKGFERGSLSVAAHPCLVETYLAPAVAAVLRGTLNLHCQMYTAGPDTLLESLRHEELECFIGLEPDGPRAERGDRTNRYLASGAVLLRAGHPLANGPPEGVKVLRVYPIVTTEVPRWYEQRTDTMATADPALADEIAQPRPPRERRPPRHHGSTRHHDRFTRLRSPRHDSNRHRRRQVRHHRSPPDEEVLLLAVPIVLVTLKDRPLPPSANAVIDQLRSRHRLTLSP